MRIGFDGKEAVMGKGKHSRFSRALISAIAESYPDVECMVYTPSLKNNDWTSKMGEFHNVRFCLPAASGFGGEMWRTFGVTNNLPADKIDVFHGVCGTLPLNIYQSGLPSVVSFTGHEDAGEKKGLAFVAKKISDYKRRKACENSAAVIVADDNAKSQLSKFYVISLDKMKVIDPEIASKDLARLHMELYRELLSK